VKARDKAGPRHWGALPADKRDLVRRFGCFSGGYGGYITVTPGKRTGALASFLSQDPYAIERLIPARKLATLPSVTSQNCIG